MDITDFDLRNILTFHVKKGVESGMYDGLITLRTTTIENVIESGKPLLVSASGEEGFMILTPKIILTRIVSQSPKIYDNVKYGLVRVPWRPTDEGTLRILNDLYALQRNLNEELDAILGRIDNNLKR